MSLEQGFAVSGNKCLYSFNVSQLPTGTGKLGFLWKIIPNL